MIDMVKFLSIHKMIECPDRNKDFFDIEECMSCPYFEGIFMDEDKSWKVCCSVQDYGDVK